MQIAPALASHDSAAAAAPEVNVPLPKLAKRVAAARRDRCTANVRTALAASATLLLAAVSAGAAPILFVDVKTDYLPHQDFVLVRIRTERTEGDPRHRHTERVAFAGDRYAAGVRVAEIELPEDGDYLVRVDLVDRRGDFLERPGRSSTACAGRSRGR